LLESSSGSCASSRPQQSVLLIRAKLSCTLYYALVHSCAHPSSLAALT
jgi:hypothetical protein